jgi:hypothetical protein
MSYDYGLRALSRIVSSRCNLTRCGINIAIESPSSVTGDIGIRLDCRPPTPAAPDSRTLPCLEAGRFPKVAPRGPQTLPARPGPALSGFAFSRLYNLAWKLALVLSGAADECLLDSCNDERQPIGRKVSDRAMKSHTEIEPWPEAAGLRPGLPYVAFNPS